MPIFNPTVITGTANQVLANGNAGTTEAGNVILTLPQSINSGASPTFNGLILSGLTGYLYGNGSSALTSSLTIPNSGLQNNSISVTNSTGIGVTGSPVSLGGTLNISNTGVTSNVAGTGISVSGATGAVTISNTGVTSINGTAGNITSSGTTGSVTLNLATVGTSGTFGQVTTDTFGRITAGSITTDIAHGGTGLSTIGTSNQLLGVDSTGTVLEYKTLSGTGISVSNSAGSIILNNTGVTSFSGGTTGFTPSIATAGAITISGTLTVSNGGTGLSATPGNGEIDIGNGTGFTRTAITQGTGISIGNAAGSITVSNTGVTSNVAGTGISVSGATGAVTISNSGVTSAVAGTGISVSGATGAVTISNSGVTSFQTSLSGLSPNTSSTGGITLSGTLGISSGGTGLSTTPTAGQLLIGNGTGYTISALTAGSGITVTNGSGSISVASSAVQPGTRNAGKVWTSTFSSLSGATTMGIVAAPVITSGWQVTTLAVTPVSSSSAFILRTSFMVDTGTSLRNIAVAVWRTVSAVNTLVGTQYVYGVTTARPESISISMLDSPATTSAVTYSIRVGADTAATTYVNQNASVQNLGASVNSVFTAQELY